MLTVNVFRRRARLFLSASLALVVTLVVTACAIPGTQVSPYAFELIDEARVVHAGTIDPHKQGMTVALGEEVFVGFYVLGVESVSSTAFPPLFRRSFGSAFGPALGSRSTPIFAPAWPMETRSTVISNHARAHLKSSAGGHLACEFILDGLRAVGTCAMPDGKTYQFVAGQ